jgi:hypothetical protein
LLFRYFSGRCHIVAPGWPWSVIVLRALPV